MDRESYNEMYANEDAHWWFVARRQILQRVLDRHLRDKKTRSVLEVGCGTGGNLRMLSAYGDLSAMELDDEARGMASSRNVCEVNEGELPNDIPFDDHSFDLICMLDVLEHIDDESAALRAVSRKMCDEGTLLITVPAYMFLWSAHDVANHHKRRYTRNQLLKTVEGSGLDVVYATYLNTPLLPIIAARRALNNIMGKESGSDVDMPSKPVNKLLQKVFASERFLLPTLSLPFGVSVLLIAQQRKTAAGE